MKTVNDLYAELKEFKKSQKTELRAHWMYFLVDMWKGHTYNDFVLLIWLQGKRSSSFHQTKVKLLNIVEDKTFLQFENLEFRERIKSKSAQEYRKKHYKSLLGFNRELINMYNDAARRTLGGGITS